MPQLRPSTIDYRSELFRDACRIIDEEYASDLFIDDVARRLASSRRQIQRAFAANGSATFSEHLTAVRMRHAATLVRQPGGMLIGDIARAVGYRQPAQFAKAFRRFHGQTPSALRRAASDEPDPADAALRYSRRAVSLRVVDVLPRRATMRTV